MKHFGFEGRFFSVATEHLQNKASKDTTVLLTLCCYCRQSYRKTKHRWLELPRDNSAAEARTLDTLCLKAPQVLPLEFSDFQPYVQSTLLHLMRLAYVTYSLYASSKYLPSHGNIPKTLRDQISDSHFFKISCLMPNTGKEYTLYLPQCLLSG